MNNTVANERSLVISYLALRTAIGILGIALPFVLSLGLLILFQRGIQSSISAYYHTGMGDVFVGTLCVIGLFLLAYRGHDSADNIAGDLACLFAVGAALFATTPDGAATTLSGYVHNACAAGFFLTLIYFSLVLFTKTDPNKSPTRRKLQRNMVYKVCGYTMAVCLVLIAIYYLFVDQDESALVAYNPVYWLEAIAVVAFGISWFTKGEAILKDEA